MVIAVTCPTDDVHTTLNYFLPRPDGTSLFVMQPSQESSSLQVNHIVDPRAVVIHNLRGQEQKFSLDSNGFQFLTHRTTEGFLEQSSIETNYYAEVRELLKEYTGAHRVIVLGHRIRQSHSGSTLRDADRVQERPPGHAVHSDRTFESAIAAARKHLGEDGDRLLQGRVRFINVWRPIGQSVWREPLAVADWQTSSDMSDLLPIRIRIPTLEASFDALVARFNAKHTWYYLRHQTPSEVTLIKCYDSHTNCARLCLHSAFHDPGSQGNVPERRSIEVNTLVFG